MHVLQLRVDHESERTAVSYNAQSKPKHVSYIVIKRETSVENALTQSSATKFLQETNKS